MPERNHNLPYSYDRLDGQIAGPVVDAIVIYLRSHGRTHNPPIVGSSPPRRLH
jgi:hypothetical protein